MQNDKSKFKNEFKKRLYKFVLKLIEFLDKLPNDNISRRIGDQLLRSGTSVIGNYVEGQAASSKKDFTNFLILLLSRLMRANYGLHCFATANVLSRKKSVGS
jgi:four helix bundle protein